MCAESHTKEVWCELGFFWPEGAQDSAEAGPQTRSRGWGAGDGVMGSQGADVGVFAASAHLSVGLWVKTPPACTWVCLVALGREGTLSPGSGGGAHLCVHADLAEREVRGCAVPAGVTHPGNRAAVSVDEAGRVHAHTAVPGFLWQHEGGHPEGCSQQGGQAGGS